MNIVLPIRLREFVDDEHRAAFLVPHGRGKRPVVEPQIAQGGRYARIWHVSVPFDCLILTPQRGWPDSGLAMTFVNYWRCGRRLRL